MDKPIRVLHVVTHMNRGGLETMIMNYYRNIDRSKVQFDFLVHRKKKAAYDDEITALGGKIYRLPTLNPFSLSYRTILSNFFDKYNYQIIHVHQDCMSSVILKEAKRHGVPVRIAHSHSSSQDKNMKYYIKLWYKRFIPKYATDLFACGDEAGNWMFNGANFKVVNNAIDAKAYSFNESVRNEMRERLGITDDEIVIGHVGRFSPTKNHTFLVDVFNELCKEKKAKLLLVGDGELRKNMEAKVNELGILDKVIFAGVQSDVASYLQAMDIFVFPSIYEGLPVTLVEAQAAGLPCIISDSIPKECIKTDLVHSCSLEQLIGLWIKVILNNTYTKRENTYNQIKLSGFDIDSNAKWLQDFYLYKAR